MNGLRIFKHEPARIIDRSGLWLLLLLAPLFLFPAPGRNWLLLILPVFWLWRGFVSGRMVGRTPADLPVFLLIVQTGVTVFVIPDIEWSMGKIAGIAFGVAIFFELAARLKDEAALRKGVVVFLAMGVGLGLVGLFNMSFVESKADAQVDLLTRIGLHLPRLHLRIPGAEEGFNPNAVAGTLALIIPVLATLLLLALRKEVPADSFWKKRAVLFSGAAGLALLLGVVAISFSRETWLALVLSGGLPLAVLVNARRRWLITAGVVLLGLLALAGAYSVLMGREGMPLSEIEMAGKAGGRTQAWAVGLEAVREHPWTGVGLNRVRLLPGIGVSRAHVHNHLIQTAAELGLPALVALVALYLLMGVMGATVWKSAPEAWMRYAVLGLGWGQLAHFLFGLTDSIPLGAKAGIFFWISLALMTAMYQLTVSSVPDGKTADVH